MGKKTIAINGKNGEDYSYKKGVAEPLQLSSAFYFNSIEEAEAAFTCQSNDYVYTRGRNPVLDAFEERMTLLEEGSSSIAFASGMGAIATLLFSLLKSGDKMIAHSILYGSSYELIKKTLLDYGIEGVFINLKDEKAVKQALDESVKVIYFETPCNPTLDIISIERIRELVGENVLIVVDNTFATPFLQRPLNQGADFVVHSCTKYIGGHGDALGGVVVCKDKEQDSRIRFEYMCHFGTVMSPFNGWLFNRGLKTLGLRMEAHSKTAMTIAKFLEQHKAVKKVFYPGLESFKDYELAKKQMSNFGGMVSFLINENECQAIQLVESLDLFKLAVSLGDVESLVEHPMRMTHRGYSREERALFGIDYSLIRLSIGFEDCEDLISDLEKGLSKVK
ncbi:hypothetical protein AZF37_08225 [endosymbiont 'TC1' of Trimyema compressum]|uniref:trans-sulfuration enzyme family protein n=1 Tax=endosymbiont 'TC1' of Trimyema compressum TaxID=243899 RepID=UPI0007F13CFA|nr:PLP-dependent aspartate aminotransferase family protein [endosymbiont 'TC1' of Trimyema compressum]AMP21146.1 hypothetical protein AZF37_08225 [endosymbiont 'TC1' of Trimyema compressum]